MLSSSTGLAARIFLSSYHGIRLVSSVLGYVWPRNMATKINFNTKHLAKGDPLPPYNGKLRVYNMRYCPYAQRALLTLIAKNLDFEVINVDLVDKPEWLITKSSFTKVPALEIEENVSIIESLVVSEYLDEAYPQRPLLPKDPLKKAFDRILVEASAQIHSVVFRLVKAPETLTDDVINAYFNTLDLIQSTLQKRGTKFLFGGQPGYVDYMIWPWFERLPSFHDERIKITAPKYKLLLDYLNNMYEDPVVKSYILPEEAYQEFNGAYSRGEKPNYNRLTEE